MMQDDEQQAAGGHEDIASAVPPPTADVVLEQEEHGERHEHADDDVHAQAEEQPQPHETLDAPADPALGDLDDQGEVVPEVDVAESLRNALGSMRTEADRIATLGTGQEQVEAAERFAEDAGRLDEQVGSAARAADDDGHG